MILPLTTSLVLVCLSPHVIDADTLVCQGERVRLWGLDGPELRTPDGPRARQQLVTLTRGKVECRAKYRDKYRRVVAMCYSSRGDLAEQMIRMGPSTEYMRYSRGYYSKDPQ